MCGGKDWVGEEREMEEEKERVNEIGDGGLGFADEILMITTLLRILASRW